MRFIKSVYAVDSHTMGEPTRVVVGGIPNVPGATMMEKKHYLEQNYDHIRTALLLEPRGHRDMFGSIILPPCSPEADLGIVFMEGDGFVNMCGHGSIGACSVAVETGLVEAKEPYKMLKHAFEETVDAEGHSHVAFQGTLQHTDTIFDVSGEGNGPIDAFFHAIQGERMDHYTFLDYKSHAITNGSDSQGVAYILLQDQRDGKKYWGVGLSHNINLAPLRAILSAINRSKRK